MWIFTIEPSRLTTIKFPLDYMSIRWHAEVEESSILIELGGFHKSTGAAMQLHR